MTNEKLLRNLAYKIKKLRIEKRLSQKQLAELIGLNKSNIGSYEENRAIPPICTIHKIATHFGVTIDFLLSD